MARRAKRRRVRTMAALVVAALATGVWALFGSGAAMSLHVAIDLVAVFYGILMYRSTRRRSQRERQMRKLARHPLSASSGLWPAGVPDLGSDLALADDPLFYEEPVAL